MGTLSTAVESAQQVFGSIVVVIELFEKSICVECTVQLMNLCCHVMQLKVYRGTLFQRMKEVIAADLCVTVNSDDPPFFGGYMNENYQFWADNLGLSEAQILQLGCNSFEAAFMADADKARLQQQVLQCTQHPETCTELCHERM